MTIRARLTLWYAGILCLSTLIIAGFSYRHFLVEQSPEKSNASLVEFFNREMEDWDDVLMVTLWFGLPVAAIGLAGGWFLMRKALAPIAALTQATEKIHERNLHERLPRTGNGDELDRLAEVLNSMIGRLDNSFQQIHEFTLHASHELKTPLTVMRGETESGLQEANLSAAQRERLQSQLDEIQRLTKIVDGLTLLTRADAGQIQLNLETVQFDELVRDAFEDAKILAQQNGIKVSMEKCEAVEIRGDKHRLRQLLLNLTDNAVKYNKSGGSIAMELRRADHGAEFKISNTGPGISAEKLPRIFERFFRGDESHGNAVDGCGLGLSIAQWIIGAHGGRVEAASEIGRLTTFTVKLPINKETGRN
jgi:signal transduction histidine kinase